jgi:hypothetical protein
VKRRKRLPAERRDYICDHGPAAPVRYQGLTPLRAHCPSRMLLKDSGPMTGAASPNQVGGANGERDQHGRTARGVGGGS